MPVTKSAAKRVRQTIKRHKRNLRLKRVMQSDIKSLQVAIAASDKAVGDKLKSAQSSLDKAVKANLIHKNKAARKKSQLVKAVKAGAKPAAKATTKKAAGTAAKTTGKAPVTESK